jgi:ankyrin repeat protein
MHKYGNTALVHAADNSCAAALIQSLHNGAKIETINDQGHQALHKAADRGSMECLTALLQAGASVNVQDCLVKSSPLHLAAAEELEAITMALIDAGATINGKTSLGVTPLPKSSHSFRNCAVRFRCFPHRCG